MTFYLARADYDLAPAESDGVRCLRDDTRTRNRGDLNCYHSTSRQVIVPDITGARNVH